MRATCAFKNNNAFGGLVVVLRESSLSPEKPRRAEKPRLRPPPHSASARRDQAGAVHHPRHLRYRRVNARRGTHGEARSMFDASFAFPDSTAFLYFRNGEAFPSFSSRFSSHSAPPRQPRRYGRERFPEPPEPPARVRPVRTPRDRNRSALLRENLFDERHGRRRSLRRGEVAARAPARWRRVRAAAQRRETVTAVQQQSRQVRDVLFTGLLRDRRAICRLVSSQPEAIETTQSEPSVAVRRVVRAANLFFFFFFFFGLAGGPRARSRVERVTEHFRRREDAALSDAAAARDVRHLRVRRLCGFVEKVRPRREG